MNVSTKVNGNPCNSYWDISLNTTNVSLMVTMEKKSAGTMNVCTTQTNPHFHPLSHTVTAVTSPPKPIKSYARYLSIILDSLHLNNMNTAASADLIDSGWEQQISSTFFLLSGPLLQTLFWLDIKIDLLRLPPQHQQAMRYGWFFIGLICKTAFRSIEIWFALQEGMLSLVSVYRGNQRLKSKEFPPTSFLLSSSTASPIHLKRLLRTRYKIPLFFICS